MNKTLPVENEPSRWAALGILVAMWAALVCGGWLQASPTHVTGDDVLPLSAELGPP